MWFYCILAFAYLVCQEVIFHKKKKKEKKKKKKTEKKFALAQNQTEWYNVSYNFTPWLR